MTELETAVEWLRDMRRIAGPHCDLASTLLDVLDEERLREDIIEAAGVDYLDEVPQAVERLADYHEAVEARLERAGVLDPTRSEPYDVDTLLAMFLPNST
jgi:hypothetical protein